MDLENFAVESEILLQHIAQRLGSKRTRSVDADGGHLVGTAVFGGRDGGTSGVKVLARSGSRPGATKCFRRNQPVGRGLTTVEHDVGHFPPRKGELNRATDLGVV